MAAGVYHKSSRARAFLLSRSEGVAFSWWMAARCQIAQQHGPCRRDFRHANLLDFLEIAKCLQGAEGFSASLRDQKGAGGIGIIGVIGRMGVIGWIGIIGRKRGIGRMGVIGRIRGIGVIGIIGGPL